MRFNISFLMVLLDFAWLSVPAQEVYVPQEGVVFVHSENPISIFDDVRIEGRLGSNPNSSVWFYGQRWTNDRSSLLPGLDLESQGEGGIFYFVNNKKQQIAGGYQVNNRKGPSFSNLEIRNRSGVELEGSNDLCIRGNLLFRQGNLYLAGQNALVFGEVEGYTEKAFVVTDGEAGEGNLYRRSDALSRLIFPIGSRRNSYSPAAIEQEEQKGEVVAARVFDDVREQVTAGPILDSHHVKKTWEFKNLPSQSFKLYLQHDVENEGTQFAPYRDSSQITMYRSDIKAWDRDSLAHRVSAGNLTTGTVPSYAFLNDRYFPQGVSWREEDSSSWFSVNINPEEACPVVDFRLWEAQRYNGQWVQLFWSTFSEANVLKYDLQRKDDTASVFITLSSFPSQTANGFSSNLNYYYATDEHPYDGDSEYRLKIYGPLGCVTYTTSSFVSYGVDIDVWPSPSDGSMHIQVTGIEHEILMQVINPAGQVVEEQVVNGIKDLQLQHLPSANYFLIFRDPKQQYKRIQTVKWMVQRANR